MKKNYTKALKVLKVIPLKFLEFITYISFKALAAILLQSHDSGQRRERELKEKVKYFEPTVTYGFWGKEVSWKMREKPLTKDELKQFF